MYRLLRQIHLVSGITLIAMLGMYFVTGYVLIRSQWFSDPPPAVAKRTVTLNRAALPAAVSDEAIGRHLQQQAGVSGKTLPPKRRPDGSWVFTFNRPGHEASVVLAADGSRLDITERTLNWKRTWIGFHRLHGYGGGLLYSAWAFLMDLSSLSMIVFAMTGVFMWYKLEKVKWPGFLLLAGGFGYVLSMIFHLL